MLYSLKIENIAIIESAEIEFASGFNVLTGETGAGKSIIIDALNAVLGERTSRELIRSGCRSAKVTAVFENAQRINPVLDELGIDAGDGGSLIITRAIYEDGKNACRVNGCPATVAMLKTIGSMLINIHGQHDNQALLLPDKHYLYIDSLADNGRVLADYKSTYHKLVSVKKELDSLCADEDEKAARLDYLNFRINEIESAGVKPGEREELSARKLLLNNSKKVSNALSAAYAAVSGVDEQPGASALAADGADKLDSAAQFFADIAPCAKSVREAQYLLEDCSGQIRALLDNLEFSPAELAEIDERLDCLFRLSSKYGASEQDILDNLAAMSAERDSIELSDERAQELEGLLTDLTAEIIEKSLALTKSRADAARAFEKRVREELDFLDMPGVEFSVSIKSAPMSSRGADSIEFLISANAGQELRPLAKIASGGELSRIMLAIKNVISAKDDIDTLIFDEIDTGISGRAAQKVAMKLKEVSGGRQVVCVTHLAQIAAAAGRHMLISKSVADAKTFTDVKLLDTDGRVRELARIIGGLNITELQLQSAKEMLDAAKLY